MSISKNIVSKLIFFCLNKLKVFTVYVNRLYSQLYTQKFTKTTSTVFNYIMVISIQFRIVETDSFDICCFCHKKFLKNETLITIMYQTALLAKLPLGGFIYILEI